MRDLLLSVAALILIFGLLLAGNSLQFTVLGLRGLSEGFSVSTLGWIGAAYFAGFIAGSLLCPLVVASAGHIRTFAALGSVVSGLALAHPLLPDPVVWGAIRFLTGFCFAGLYMVVESWLNARADNKLRGRLLSIYATCVFGGYAIGPLLAGLASADGFVLFVVASMLVSFALVPVTLTRAGAPVGGDFHRSERFGLWALFRNSPLGFVGVLSVGAAHGGFMGLGPVFASTTSVGSDWTGPFMTVAMVTGMLLQLPVGWLSDRFDRRIVILLVALASAAAFAGLALLFLAGTETVSLLLVAADVIGAGIFPVYAVVLAYANDWLDDDMRIPAAATLILVYSIGSTAGAPIVSGFLTVLGAPGFLLYLAALMGMFGLFTLFRMSRRASPEEQADQAANVIASPGTIPLDPNVVLDEQAGEQR